jgi:hypothetical protein
MAWVDTTSPKDVFVKAWKIYVRPGEIGGPPKTAPPDYYWSPRSGTWNLYPASLNVIEDKGWPKTEIPAFLPDPEKIFAEITSQYRNIPQDLQHHAYWDPRIAKWMSLTGRGNPSAKQAELGKLLEEVNALQGKDFLSISGAAKMLEIIKDEMGRR